MAEPFRHVPNYFMHWDVENSSFTANLRDEKLNREFYLYRACEHLMNHYMPRMVSLYKNTFIKSTGKFLLNDDLGEQLPATLLSALLMIQLNGDPLVCHKLRISLFIHLSDASAFVALRSKCCRTLSLMMCFGEGINMNFVYQVMEALERIFSGSYFNQQDSEGLANITPYIDYRLHIEAVTAWTLLLTMVPSSKLHGWNGEKRQILPAITDLLKLFNGPYLNIREATTELFPVLLECGRKLEPNFLEQYKNDMIDKVKELVFELKYYENKQKKQKIQKITIQNILDFLEHNTPLNFELKLEDETLKINSWVMYHHFMTLFSVLGDGMFTHLRENDFIRRKLQMRPKIHKSKFYDPDMEKIQKFMQNLKF